MRRRLLLVALLLLPLPLGAQQPLEPRLDSIFSAYTSATPGCALGVAAPGVGVQRAWGLADLERGVPFTTGTISEAGSVSKQFVAAAVLKLAEAGKLSLDDDIRKYIPEVPDFGHVITIRELLGHTSGLRDWGTVAALQGWPRGTRAYNNYDVLGIIGRQSRLNFEPGREWSYNNSGYNLSAILVQRVSGVSLAEFTRRELFEPLGMTHTSWRDDYQRIVPGRALAYGFSQGAYRTDMPNESAYGNGGLLTTVGDLLTWNAALDSGRVLGKPIVAEMEKEGSLTGGKPTGYGLGLFLGNWHGEREVSHAGGTAGYRAFLARYPERGVSVALLCNVASADPGELVHRVAGLLLPATPRKATPSPAAPRAPRVTLRPTQLARFAGLYRNRATMQPYVVQAAAGGLLLQGTRMEPVSATEFRNATGGDSRLVFLPHPGQRADALALRGRDTLYLDPVAPADTSSGHLADYTGDWHNDEAYVTWTIALEQGHLVARLGRNSYPLRPIYTDGFDGGDFLWIFNRDGAGKVVGLGVWQERGRDMRFGRVE